MTNLDRFRKELAEQRLTAQNNHNSEMENIQKELTEKRKKLDELAEKIKKEKAKHEEKMTKLREKQNLEKENRKKQHSAEIDEHMKKIASCVQNYASLEDDQKSHNQRVITANNNENKNREKNLEIIDIKYHGEMVAQAISNVLDSIEEGYPEESIKRSVENAIKKIADLETSIDSSENEELQELKNIFTSLNSSENWDIVLIEEELKQFNALLQNLKATENSSVSVLKVIAEKPKEAIKGI